MSRPTSKTTWPKLVKAEPRLIELFRQAEAISSENDPHFCANKVWIKKLKPRLAGLVGGEVKDHPMLGSIQAYDIASRMVFRVLPGCQDCSCM